MKRVLSLISFFAICIGILAQQTTVRQHGTATQLVVDGAPYLIIGGETSNSAASSPDDIARCFAHLHRMGLNTVLVPNYWDLFEPVEGQYDFSLVDAVINEARRNDLRVVYLWFGAWKNSMSCYAPEWFKTDYKRFPRAHTKAGKPLEIASAFSENVFKADNRAFEAWLRHLKEVDGERGTVLMVQIENEIGMLEDARDYSPEAVKQYQSAVPQELMTFLKKNRQTLHPQLKARLDSLGTEKLKNPTWGEAFGTDVYGDEYFTAYYYARYVERMAQSVQAIYPLPVYVNAAMNSRGRKPGQYPAAGPLAHLKDIWHAAAPSLLCLAPDLYDSGFTSWTRQYALPDNPLFIPEIRRSEANGAQACYVFAEHDAISFSPFAIEDGPDSPDYKPTQAYAMLRNLMPIITEKQGQGQMHGLYFDGTLQKGQDPSCNEAVERIIHEDGMKITCRHFFTLPWDPRATDGTPWPVAGAMLIRLNKYEYLLAGNGVVVQFENEGERQIQKKLGEDGFVEAGTNQRTTEDQWSGARRIGIAYCDQVEVASDGSLKYLRRLNGDQDHQGRHIRIGVDDWQILHVKLYEYK